MGQTFTQLNVQADLCSILKAQGIVKATPVQEAAIPLIRSGADVVVQAQTGTGKTLAFLLPIIEKIKPNVPVAQALIIAPTRELALQITKVAEKVCESREIRSLTIYGGQAIERQLHKLERGPQIIIGTPGRILDHLRRKTIDITSVNKVVLDEADQMLHMGFIDDVETLLKNTANDRQLMFFSATIPDRIRALSRRYMNAPQDVQIDPENITLEGIEQIIIDTNEDNKLDKLCGLINEYQPYLAMVFCHTKQRVATLTTALAQRGYLVDELHGDLSQAKRTQVMKKFATAKLQILVATDIAARGLDVEGVTHVFNYDIPHDAETYIHRIGRTGRAGELGKAITFVNARQQDYLRLIERTIKLRIHKQKSLLKEQKEQKEQQSSPNKQFKADNKTATKPFVSRSKYANRKGAKHSGSNSRSRRNIGGSKPSATSSRGRSKKR